MTGFWLFWQSYLQNLQWVTDDGGLVQSASDAQIQGWIYFLGIYFVVSALMLILHRARAQLTLAPMLAFCGLLTFLVWQLAQIGWWVDWQDFKINAALLSIIPALLMGGVITYAMDGTRAARAYHAVLIGGTVLGMGYAVFLDILGQVTPTPSIFIAPLLMQIALAAALAIAVIAAILATETARRVSVYLALPLGFIAGMVTFLPLWSVLTYGFSNGLLNISLEWPEYLLIGAPAVPLLLLYNWLGVRANGMMPERPVFHFIAAQEQMLREYPPIQDTAVIEARSQIGELRQLNMALQQAEALRHQQMQLSPLAMLELDRHLRLSRFNTASETMLVRDNNPPFALGVSLADYFPEITTAMAGTDWQAQKLLKQQLTLDGGQVIEWMILPIGDLKQPIGYSVLAQDVTAREQAAQRRILSERIRGIHQTGQVIHHDFSNLMLAIQSHLQVVLQNIPAERMTGGEVEQALLAIQNASDRGRDMLTQLGAGQVFQKPALQPVALAQIIHDAVRLITPQARSQGIAITTDIDASFWVEVDITQISRVVMNLLSNALRAIGQNGQIDVVTQADQNGITLVVQDNGCGMNSEQLAKAFDPGFSTKGQGQGGLGLAISYLIIEAHGGRLSLSSENGRGTIAKIWLPLWHGQNQGHYDIKTKPSPSFASENILLLLNQNDLRQRLAEHFGACGSEVAELANTQELAAVLLEAPEYWTILIRGKDIALDPALWHQCRYLSDIVLDQSGKSPPRIRLNANSNISAEEILAELRTA